MAPKKLNQAVESVESFWEEMVYTEARLLYDENAKEFVLVTSNLVGEAEQVRLGQLGKWRGETIAQAHVDIRNFILDVTTKTFEKSLRRLLEDAGDDNPTQSPRYKAYFPIPLSQVIGKALESQIQFIKPWLGLLVNEPEPELVAFLAIFTEQINLGEKALAERRGAQANTRSHRLQDISDLFEKGNTERLALHGKLSTRAAEKKLSRDWPESFFHKNRRRRLISPEERKRVLILETLDVREIELSEENLETISKAKDPALLDRWLARAGSVKQQEDLFA